VNLNPLILAAHAGCPATKARTLAHRAGRVVARIDTNNGPAILKADTMPDAFGVEVAAIGRLAAAGLPVPKVLIHAPGPPDILILSWTDGEALSRRSTPWAQQDAGRILRRIHDLGAEPQFSGQPTVDAWISEWLDEVVGWWRTEGGGTQEQAARLRRWHHTLHPTLSSRGGDLMLFDGRPEHFLVDDTQVVGLIDLHDVGPGDAAMDLAVIHLADPLLTPGVLRGYEPSRREKAEFDALVPFFTVIRALAGAQWHHRHDAAENVGPLLARAMHELAKTHVP
jgi:aminoglycoside phosphotransferase (APT) family kinase protein